MRAPYWLRRFRVWLRTPELVCGYLDCPEPRVGFAVWCREHVDRIMAHNPDDDCRQWPVKKGTWRW